MISIDIETYSDLDIKKVGVYKYAENCELLLIAYAMDDDPVKCVDVANGEEIPSFFINALMCDTILKTAWNATFERVVLSQTLASYLNGPLSAEDWDCTQLRAAYRGLSLTLGKTAEILGTSVQKMKTNLIPYFCKPFKGAPRARTGDRWEEFKTYNKIDVDTERAVRKKLTKVNVESSLVILDAQINARGVLVDKDLIENALILDAQHVARAKDDMKKITGLGNPNSTVQLQNWLKEQGVYTCSIDKEHVDRLLNSELDDHVRKVLELRKECSKTSSKKYVALKRSVCNDGRLRGLTQMCGATRTGRWAGRVVQVHNLYKNKAPTLDNARAIVKSGYDVFLTEEDDILSELVRTSFISSTGLLTIADFSAIEARVLAWLAQEKWVMDVFAGDGKIYEATAAKMYGVKLEAVTKELRQKGKVATLALGYQGSIGALRAMRADGTDEELLKLVEDWRKVNPNIVRLWGNVEKTAKSVILDGKDRSVNSLIFMRDDNWLHIALPSGRRLSYWNPRIPEDTILYGGLNSGVWVDDLETYGGKLVENIVQGIARDCLAVALFRCRHLPIVMHVHDEIILEGDCLTEVLDIMEKPIHWAKDLILKGDGFTNEYYKK